MSTIQGYRCSLFIRESGTGQYQPLAFEVSATINISNSLTGVATKENQAAIKNAYGSKSYTISLELLYTDKNLSPAVSEGLLNLTAFPNTARLAAELMKFANDQKKLDFKLTQNKAGTTEYSGTALIESVEVATPTDGESTASVSLTGDGALKIVDLVTGTLTPPFAES